jgi:hypothetical protein
MLWSHAYFQNFADRHGTRKDAIPVSPRFVLPILVAVGLTACHSAGSAQLRVVGVQPDRPNGMVIHVQVVNRTAKPMRLQRLEYRFAGSGTIKVGLDHRQIAPGAAAVVEVQLDEAAPAGGLLKGNLFAELDQIVESFPVTAQVGEPGT